MEFGVPNFVIWAHKDAVRTIAFNWRFPELDGVSGAIPFTDAVSLEHGEPNVLFRIQYRRMSVHAVFINGVLPDFTG